MQERFILLFNHLVFLLYGLQVGLHCRDLRRGGEEDVYIAAFVLLQIGTHTTAESDMHKKTNKKTLSIECSSRQEAAHLRSEFDHVRFHLRI